MPQLSLPCLRGFYILGPKNCFFAQKIHKRCLDSSGFDKFYWPWESCHLPRPHLVRLWWWRNRLVQLAPVYLSTKMWARFSLTRIHLPEHKASLARISAPSFVKVILHPKVQQHLSQAIFFIRRSGRDQFSVGFLFFLCMQMALVWFGSCTCCWQDSLLASPSVAKGNPLAWWKAVVTVLETIRCHLVVQYPCSVSIVDIHVFRCSLNVVRPLYVKLRAPFAPVTFCLKTSSSTNPALPLR